MYIYLKASPLPPAPQVTGDWQDQDCRTGRIGRTGRTGRTGRVVKKVILGTKICYLGGLEASFWHLGARLGDPGVSWDTQQDTWGSRLGFLSIFRGFWDPPGTLFGVNLVTFWWFGAPKWQYGYQVGFLSDL